MRTDAGPNACHPHQAITIASKAIANNVASATTTRSGHSLIAPMAGTSAPREHAPQASAE
jgi:hypothetical protein